MARADGMVLVTGASGSIGRATVRALDARGRDVVTVDRRPLPEPESSIVVKHLEVDLADDDAAGAIATIAPGRDLRHAIAVAGGGDAEELALADPATEELRIFDRVVRNNLRTAFVTIRHVVPLLRASSGDRSITLVGSINAFGGYGAPGYSAAKAGLAGLANALTAPLGADGIRINCLVPGTVDTANLRDLAASRGVQLDLGSLAAKAPLGRVLDATDVAAALVAMSLDMRGMTGASVVLDNGQTHIR
ncbi:MAG: SDR family oxidoreductase [Actinomycetota bacterium]|nr:SDR family oxidoreductase [Actinomycetota bacterium]